MPSVSKKQQRFFGLVRAVQKGEKPSHEVSPEVRKVAGSISAKDAGDFARSVAELATKKAVLGILKDCVQPVYLGESDEEIAINPIAKEFHVKDKFDEYVKRYIGQPLSPKEMEAVNTFKEVKPTKIGSRNTEIWYENTDEFKNSTTTVIKKMKDGAEFSFNAFQKHSSAQPEEEPTPGQPTEPTPTGTPTGEPTGAPAPGAEPEQPPMEEEKDDIIVSKSPLFKDEIKGGAILVEFLKKLDL